MKEMMCEERKDIPIEKASTNLFDLNNLFIKIPIKKNIPVNNVNNNALISITNKIIQNFL